MQKFRVLIFAALLLSIAAMSVGCSYGSTATTKDGHVIITKNDSFLWGALRTVYVCKLTPNGLADCQEAVSP